MEMEICKVEGRLRWCTVKARIQLQYSCESIEAHNATMCMFLFSAKYLQKTHIIIMALAFNTHIHVCGLFFVSIF